MAPVKDPIEKPAVHQQKEQKNYTGDCSGATRKGDYRGTNSGRRTWVAFSFLVIEVMYDFRDLQDAVSRLNTFCSLEHWISEERDRSGRKGCDASTELVYGWGQDMLQHILTQRWSSRIRRQTNECSAHDWMRKTSISSIFIKLKSSLNAPGSDLKKIYIYTFTNIR